MVPGHLEKPCSGTALFNEISTWFWLDLGKSCAALAQRNSHRPWSTPAPLSTSVTAWALEAVVSCTTVLEMVHPLSTTSWSCLLLTITPFSWYRERMRGWSHPYSALWAQFSVCCKRPFARSLAGAAQDCTIQASGAATWVCMHSSALEEAQTVPCNSLSFKALGNFLKACPSPMSAVTSFARHWNIHCVGEVMTVKGESTHNVNLLSPCTGVRRGPNKWPCKEENLVQLRLAYLFLQIFKKNIGNVILQKVLISDFCD